MFAVCCGQAGGWGSAGGYQSSTREASPYTQGSSPYLGVSLTPESSHELRCGAARAKMIAGGAPPAAGR